jgi:hypothetical protein
MTHPTQGANLEGRFIIKDDGDDGSIGLIALNCQLPVQPGRPWTFNLAFVEGVS